MVASRRLLRFAGALACAFSTSDAAIVSDDFMMEMIRDGHTMTHSGRSVAAEVLLSRQGATICTHRFRRTRLRLGPDAPAACASMLRSPIFSLRLTSLIGTTASDQAFGLLSRVREVGLGTTDGYGFLYVPVDHDFEIARFDNEADHRIGPIMAISLDPARDYRITFAGTGNVLTGEVFDLGDLTTPLLSLTAIDAALSQRGDWLDRCRCVYSRRCK
jgi:hypothetical protein